MSHWARTKLADRIRGTAKPLYNTNKAWREWKEAAKQRHPFRYWLVEVALDKLEDAIKWPAKQIYNLKYYIVNRWIDQSHALVAHPNHIKPGRWQDLDYRILYCTFDELVDFVEIEKAYANYRWDEDKIGELKWWQGGRWRTRTWRSAESGLSYLKWESELSDEEAPSSQAEAAKEILFLYDWWVNVRPKREDPMEVSGWSAYCDTYRDEDLFAMFDEDNGIDTKPMHDKMRELETQYNEEDTEMLIRLIKIRGYLWT